MKNPGKALLLSVIALISLSLLVGPAAAAVKLVKGQTLYVPCSISYMAEDYPFDVRATIFIYNTDPKHAITINRLDFYDTSGKFVKKYLAHPMKLQPSAGAYIHINRPETDEEGAVAHVIVQWQAKIAVVEPIIISLMLGSRGTRGYTFSPPVRIIHEVD